MQNFDELCFCSKTAVEYVFRNFRIAVKVSTLHLVSPEYSHKTICVSIDPRNCFCVYVIVGVVCV